MLSIGGVTMQEKRIRSDDRRKNERMPKVPFRDCNGDIVALDRRYIPDRRMTDLGLKFNLQNR